MSDSTGVIRARARAPSPCDRPAPRWAHTVAHLIPLTTLPSGLWRIGIASGLSLGMLDHGRPIHLTGWESVYLVCLSLMIEGLRCSPSAL